MECWKLFPQQPLRGFPLTAGLPAVETVPSLFSEARPGAQGPPSHLATLGPAQQGRPGRGTSVRGAPGSACARVPGLRDGRDRPPRTPPCPGVKSQAAEKG